jgi:hypothetical protein
MTPESQKYQIRLAKSNIGGAGVAVGKNVAVEQCMQLVDGNGEKAGGFLFGVKLLHRL